MSSMNLTDMKDLYRNTDAYIDKEVTVGGWVRSIRDSKTFGFIVVNDGTFLNLFRWCMMIPWRILIKSPNSM